MDSTNAHSFLLGFSWVNFWNFHGFFSENSFEKQIQKALIFQASTRARVSFSIHLLMSPFFHPRNLKSSPKRRTKNMIKIYKISSFSKLIKNPSPLKIILNFFSYLIFDTKKGIKNWKFSTFFRTISLFSERIFALIHSWKILFKFVCLIFMM